MTLRQQIIVFWVLFAATTAIYAVMVMWSLPKISTMAGGLAPFDMRPMGYSLDEATAFLTALTDEGRTFYLSTQHWLDTFYPPLLALTLAIGLRIMSPVQSPAIKLLLVVIPILAMLADLFENTWVSFLLNSPGYIDAGAVEYANVGTLIKSILTTLTMSLLLLFTSAWGWRKWWRT